MGWQKVGKINYDDQFVVFSHWHAEIGALFPAEVVKGTAEDDRKENNARLLRRKYMDQVAHVGIRKIARSPDRGSQL